MANSGRYNPARVEQEIVEVARQMLKENDDIGATVLECTELSPHAVASQNTAPAGAGLHDTDERDLLGLCPAALPKTHLARLGLQASGLDSMRCGTHSPP